MLMIFWSLALLVVAVSAKLRGLQTESLTQVVANTPNLALLDSLIVASDLTTVIDSLSAATLFAPENAAIEAILPSAGKLTDVQYKAHLVNLLSYHVLPSDTLDSASVPTTPTVFSTANGEEVTIVQIAGTVYIYDTTGLNSTVSAPDLPASNGFVHTIDRVLLPVFVSQTLVNKAEELSMFSTLLNLVGRFDNLLVALADPSLNITLLAPTNDAFGLLNEKIVDYLVNNNTELEKVLRDHVILQVLPSTNIDLFEETPINTIGERDVTFEREGTAVLVNGVSISSFDNIAFNGVLHATERVLIPDIVGILAEDGRFGTLLSLVGKFDFLLQAALDKDATLTILAPIDAAFESVNAKILEFLTSGTTEGDISLVNVLSNHIIDEIIFSRDIVFDTPIETLGPSPVTFEQIQIFVNVDSVPVLDVDSYGCNGVVHSVSDVLLSDVFTLLKESGYTTFVDLPESIDRSILDGLRLNRNEFTIFAPTNEAFSALGPNITDFLVANIEMLYDTIWNHIVPDIVPSTDLPATGETIIFTDTFGNLPGTGELLYEDSTLNDAAIIDTDNVGVNCIVHGVNAVLFPSPEQVLSAFRTTTLLSILDPEGSFPEILAFLSDRSNSFTLFAPTDEAFQSLNPAIFAYLSANVESLRGILLSHVTDSTLWSATLPSGGSLQSLGSTPLSFEVDGDLVINGVGFLGSFDGLTYSGFIHEVDAVLLPKLFVDGEFENLDTAASLASIIDPLLTDSFTFFVPNDDAFMELFASTEIGQAIAADPAAWLPHLEKILSYHIIGDAILFANNFTTGEVSAGPAFPDDPYQVDTSNGVSVNGNNVVNANILRKDGVLHVIDGVLVPSFATTGLIDQLEAQSSEFPVSITIDLIKKAGLFEALNDAAGAKTLLMPLDSAYDGFTQDQLNGLASNTDLLVTILTYHVIPGINVQRQNLNFDDATEFTTLNGESLSLLRASSSAAFADGTSLLIEGIANEATSEDFAVARNGIAYYIDAVLLPTQEAGIPSGAPTMKDDKAGSIAKSAKGSKAAKSSKSSKATSKSSKTSKSSSKSTKS